MLRSVPSTKRIRPARAEKIPLQPVVRGGSRRQFVGLPRRRGLAVERARPQQQGTALPALQSELGVIRRNHESAVLPPSEQRPQKRRDDGSVQVPFRFVDQQQRGRWRREHVRRDQQDVPFAVRELRRSVLRSPVLARRHLLVVPDEDLDRDVGLAEQLVDDGDRRLGLRFRGQIVHPPVVVGPRHRACTTVFRVDQFEYGDARPFRRVRVAVARLVVLVLVPDVLLGLQLVGRSQIQRVGLHPGLPVRGDLPRMLAVLRVEMEHQTRLAGSVGPEYEQGFSDIQSKRVHLARLRRKAQVERHTLLRFCASTVGAANGEDRRLARHAAPRPGLQAMHRRTPVRESSPRAASGPRRCSRGRSPTRRSMVIAIGPGQPPTSGRLRLSAK